jgi:hypothetical protein
MHRLWGRRKTRIDLSERRSPFYREPDNRDREDYFFHSEVLFHAIPLLPLTHLTSYLQHNPRDFALPSFCPLWSVIDPAPEAIKTKFSRARRPRDSATRTRRGVECRAGGYAFMCQRGTFPTSAQSRASRYEKLRPRCRTSFRFAETLRWRGERNARQPEQLAFQFHPHI